ncbi:hypothetical protein JD551_00625 [Aeromonas caviae]|uniref:hypothetical protein n=1 Tax=Aeromonas caviae TaxID=648 RepID=UPI00191FE077|nr:hypothetical protein [Aeromonas caviae]MBL0547601.1 hypothetical protein [Aeromonas caviae]
MLINKFEMEYILNYSDLRANEIECYVDGSLIPSKLYSKRMVTNTRTIQDAIDQKELIKLITDRDYVLKIIRNFPFTENLIDIFDNILKERGTAQRISLVYISDSYTEKYSVPHSIFRINNNGNVTEEKLNHSNLERGSYVFFEDDHELHNSMVRSYLYSSGQLSTKHLPIGSSTVFDNGKYKFEKNDIVEYISKQMPYYYRGLLSALLDVTDQYRDYIYIVDSIHKNRMDGIHKFKSLTKRIDGSYLVEDIEEQLILFSNGIGRTEHSEIIHKGKVIKTASNSFNVQLRSASQFYQMVDEQGFCGGVIKRDGGLLGVGHKKILELLKQYKYNDILFLGLGLGLIQSKLKDKNILNIENSQSVIDSFHEKSSGDVILFDAFQYISKINNEFEVIVVDINDGLNVLLDKYSDKLVSLKNNNVRMLINSRSLTKENRTKLNLLYSGNFTVHSLGNFNQVVVEI